MELNNEPIRLIWVLVVGEGGENVIKSNLKIYRDEEIENGMALMPKKKETSKENIPEEDYEPHKHRNVPHPTS